MPIQGLFLQVSYPFHDAPDEHVKVCRLSCKQPPASLMCLVLREHCCMMQPEMLRRARVYDSHTRQWALITPAQEWEDGEVCYCFNMWCWTTDLSI